MDILFLVLAIIAVAGIGATVKELLLDGYGPRPVQPDLVRREPAPRPEVPAPAQSQARRPLRVSAPRHPRSLG